MMKCPCNYNRCVEVAIITGCLQVGGMVRLGGWMCWLRWVEVLQSHTYTSLQEVAIYVLIKTLLHET